MYTGHYVVVYSHVIFFIVDITTSCSAWYLTPLPKNKQANEENNHKRYLFGRTFSNRNLFALQNCTLNEEKHIFEIFQSIFSNEYHDHSPKPVQWFAPYAIVYSILKNDANL